MIGPWKKETIPNSDRLYMRVHATKVQDGRPELGIFSNRSNPSEPDAPRAMSTDWCKYSTPQETQARALSSLPAENGVISLNVGGVRGLYMQQVEHSPWYQDPEDLKIPNNQAHTDVIGPKSPKEVNGADERIAVLTVRAGLLELSDWVISPPAHGI